MTKALHLWNGKPTSYGFACGYAQLFTLDAENRMSMYKEHGCFYIVGFEEGKHFRDAYHFLKSARAAFSQRAARMQNARIYRRTARTAQSSIPC